MLRILDFKQFFKHFVFIEDGYGGLKKVQKKELEVTVYLSPVCARHKS
jgi:predicted hydrocarbon binding protein